MGSILGPILGVDFGFDFGVVLGSILGSSWVRFWGRLGVVFGSICVILYNFENAIDWAKALIVHSPTLEGTGERAGHFVLKSISEKNWKVPYT